jgi:hypothetical protein
LIKNLNYLSKNSHNGKQKNLNEKRTDLWLTLTLSDSCEFRDSITLSCLSSSTCWAPDVDDPTKTTGYHHFSSLLPSSPYIIFIGFSLVLISLPPWQREDTTLFVAAPPPPPHAAVDIAYYCFSTSTRWNELSPQIFTFKIFYLTKKYVVIQIIFLKINWFHYCQRVYFSHLRRQSSFPWTSVSAANNKCNKPDFYNLSTKTYRNPVLV